MVALCRSDPRRDDRRPPPFSTRLRRGRERGLVQEAQYLGWELFQQLPVEFQVEVVEPPGEVPEDPRAQSSLSVLVCLDFPQERAGLRANKGRDALDKGGDITLGVDEQSRPGGRGDRSHLLQQLENLGRGGRPHRRAAEMKEHLTPFLGWSGRERGGDGNCQLCSTHQGQPSAEAVTDSDRPATRPESRKTCFDVQEQPAAE